MRVFTGLAALSQTWWELALFRFHHGARHRRRMGGGRGAGRGSLAGGQTHQGGGLVAIGVGGRISGGGHPQPAPAPSRLASHVRGRRRPGGGRALRPFVGQGTGTLGQGACRGTTSRHRASAKTGGTVCAGTGSRHAGRVRAGVCGRVRSCGARRTGRRRSSALCRICRA